MAACAFHIVSVVHMKASNYPTKVRNWRDEAMTEAIEPAKRRIGVKSATKEYAKELLVSSSYPKYKFRSKAIFIFPKRG